MKTELLRHIEILKTVPEIKESIEELKFGCKFIFEENMCEDCIIDNIFTVTGFKYDSHDEDYNSKPDYIVEILGVSDFISQNSLEISNHEIEHSEKSLEKSIIEGLGGGKIIGQVEERHLRMFLDRKEYDDYQLGISTNGTIYKYPFDSYNPDIEIVSLDNSKSYMEQSEEFYKKFSDWLVNEFNIKN